ncbi:MAG: hypothetical protein HC834_07165 [Rhodospirillales bacterium]|nr:hypothetical protein [Rhodospirillales bacterium]
MDGQPIVGPAKDMVLGIYYLTMDPTVEIVTLKDRADEFRTFDALKDPNNRVGIALRSNGYYWALNHDIVNLNLFEDVIEQVEGERPKTKEKAIDRTIRALLEGEVDCMLANAYEMRKLMRQQGLEDRLTISNLHERRLVVDLDEVEYLYNLSLVGLHTPILLGNYYDERGPQDEPEPTTVGRAIFNRILPDDIRFVQETLDKKKLQNLVDLVFRKLGSETMSDVVDKIKDLGFHYATISGTTVAIADLTVPEERADICASG